MRGLVAAVLLLGLAGEARAWDFGVNAGAIEVIGLPGREHVALYPYAGFSLVFPMRKVALIPSLSVEAAPEIARWGFVWSLVADVPVHDRLGIDLDVTVIHDQSGADLGSIEWLVGGGVGFSVFVGKWTISPFVNLFRDLTVDAWALVPGLNLAVVP